MLRKKSWTKWRGLIYRLCSAGGGSGRGSRGSSGGRGSTATRSRGCSVHYEGKVTWNPSLSSHLSPSLAAITARHTSKETTITLIISHFPVHPLTSRVSIMRCLMLCVLGNIYLYAVRHNTLSSLWNYPLLGKVILAAVSRSWRTERCWGDVRTSPPRPPLTTPTTPTTQHHTTPQHSTQSTLITSS